MHQGWGPYFKGYVIIRAKGPKIEAFLNAVARSGVRLWEAERLASDMLIGRVHAPDFRAVCQSGRATGIRIGILEKVGLPFLLHRLWRRKFLLLGGTLATTTLVLLSQYVWFLQVIGTDRLDPQAIVKAARDAGLHIGSAKRALNREAVVRDLMLRFDRLAWANVHFKGTLATIEVAEKVLPEDLTGQPGNVIALEDGLLHRFVVLRGQALAKPGDTVKKGQLLISGMLQPGSPEYREQIDNGEPPYVHAEGEVIARVWYTGYGEQPLVKFQERPTGRSVTVWSVNWGDKQWRFGPEVPFQHFSVEREVRQIGWRGLHLPVQLQVEQYCEWTPVAVPVDVAVAIEQAKQAAWHQIRQRMPQRAEVQGEPRVEVQHDSSGEVGVVRLWLHAEVLQDIRAFQPIGAN